MGGRQGDLRVAIVGGGFSGLAAACELARLGVRATVIEKDAEIGGLAGTFPVEGRRVEKFYHHLYTSDRHVMELIEQLGAADQVLVRRTRTGLYHAGRIFQLSTPWDVLRFTPLALSDRVRLGLLPLRARHVAEWRSLEDQTAEQWLRRLCGDEVYRVVWEPLLRGKFGRYAPQVSAAYIWNKLKLRGGSRGWRGQELLAYYRGGFAALARLLADHVRRWGGEVLTGRAARELIVENGRAVGVRTADGDIPADAVILTPALPMVADLTQPHVSKDCTDHLRRIEYLAILCVVLELDRSLSSTYWLNVNDRDFPYVAVIEHTNFEPPESYGGRHIVYLSKYLTPDEPLYGMNDQAVLDCFLRHLRRMFPRFDRASVLERHVWRARYAQPVVVRRYGELIPGVRMPLDRLYLCTMAQVHPADRGVNYAVRDGRKVAADVAGDLYGDA